MIKGVKLDGFSNYWIFPTLGMVWSNPRKDKLGRRVKGGWIGNKMPNGYWKIALIDDDGVTHHFRRCRLIWMAVNGEILESYEINHLDETPSNDSIFNLSCISHTDNINYGTRNERSAQKHSKQVAAYQNGILIMTFPSTAEAGRNGFSQGVVAACCRGERQSHKGYQWRYLN